MSKIIISPTIGRRVWYWPGDYDLGLLEHKPATIMVVGSPNQAFDAGIAYVHGDRCINITVADHNGNLFQRTSVPLLQEGDTPFPGQAYAQWMPYQHAQAAKPENQVPQPDPAPAAIDHQTSGAVFLTEDPDHVKDEQPAATAG